MALQVKCLLPLFLAVSVLTAESLHGKNQDVLLIGNSYTIYTKNAFESAVGGDPDHTLYVEMVAVGGSTLAAHYLHRFGQIRSALQSRAWDIVVMQEHSLGPINNPAGFLQGAIDIAAMVAQDSPGAEIWLFETWARRAGHTIYTGGYTPAQMQQDLRDQYNAVAAVIGANVIPVGDVFEKSYAIRPFPQLNLHDTDGSHQNDAGKYLCGLTLYSVLFDVPASNTSYTGGVSATDLALFHQSTAAITGNHASANSSNSAGGGGCAAQSGIRAWSSILLLMLLFSSTHLIRRRSKHPAIWVSNSTLVVIVTRLTYTPCNELQVHSAWASLENLYRGSCTIRGLVCRTLPIARCACLHP